MKLRPEEEAVLAKMVRNFSVSESKVGNKADKVQKEEEDSENSSFEEVNDREEEEENYDEGNLRKLKSLATINEESLRTHDHEETKVRDPLLSYMSSG